MDMVIFFLLLFSFIAFALFLLLTIISALRKRSWKKNAYISGGSLLTSFLLFVILGITASDENEVMSEQRSEIISHESSIEEYEEQVSQLEAEIDTLNEEIENLNNNEQVDESNDVITELENEISEQQEIIEGKDEEIKELSEKDSESEELQPKIDELEDSISELEKENEELSQLNSELTKENEESEDESDSKTVSADEKEEKSDGENDTSPEKNIEKIIKDVDKDISSVSIEKDGELYKPTVIVDGRNYSLWVETSAKNVITDIVYALKESDYKYGFITIEIEMNFIDKYGNEEKGTGYKAEFTQEILDELSEDKFAVRDREMIDQVANYWFAHPGI